jgi:hypothetical protein
MDIKEVTANPVVRYTLILLLGIGIGAVFYPTKHIEERERQKHELEMKKVLDEHAEQVKSLHQTIDAEVKHNLTLTKQYESKIHSLTSEIHDLKSKTKTSYYKIVRPDGTVEIKKFSESEVSESTKVITEIQQEFTEKVTSIEKKWETIHTKRVEELKTKFDSKLQEYQKQIDELEKSKVVDVNPKKFGLEAGMMTSGSYYGHVNADLFGPIFVGAHAQLGLAPAAGLGLGLRF